VCGRGRVHADPKSSSPGIHRRRPRSWSGGSLERRTHKSHNHSQRSIFSGAPPHSSHAQTCLAKPRGLAEVTGGGARARRWRRGDDGVRGGHTMVSSPQVVWREGECKPARSAAQTRTTSGRYEAVDFTPHETKDSANGDRSTRGPQGTGWWAIAYPE
jgi:hypothetical protein